MVLRQDTLLCNNKVFNVVNIVFISLNNQKQTEKENCVFLMFINLET